MKTTKFFRKDDAERAWWLVDVADQRLGRVATQIANLLRGKHKATFTPNQDNGDFVVVVNAEKVQMTGNKMTEKKYYRHSRFFGSLKEKTAAEKQAEDPAFLIVESVRGMLPDNRLSYQLIKKLKVYAGAEHPHARQKPQAHSVSPTR